MAATTASRAAKASSRAASEPTSSSTRAVPPDIILDFDPASGDVVRISKTILGQKTFSGLYRQIADDASGDAVLKLADGGSIRFDGIARPSSDMTTSSSSDALAPSFGAPQ